MFYFSSSFLDVALFFVNQLEIFSHTVLYYSLFEVLRIIWHTKRNSKQSSITFLKKYFFCYSLLYGISCNGEFQLYFLTKCIAHNPANVVLERFSIDMDGHCLSETSELS